MKYYKYVLNSENDLCEIEVNVDEISEIAEDLILMRVLRENKKLSGPNDYIFLYDLNNSNDFYSSIILLKKINYFEKIKLKEMLRR